MYLHVSPGGKHILSSKLHQPGDLVDLGIQASIADFRRGDKGGEKICWKDNPERLTFSV